MSGIGRAGLSTVRQGRSVQARFGGLWCGGAGKVSLGADTFDAVWYGRLGRVSRGLDGSVRVWLGKAGGAR
jgi:hypothetical protein